jgi:septal ring factor EnvC (AmiA/AmiB activator)
MTKPTPERNVLQKQLEEKKRLRAELEASIPAHSIRPHQVQRIEDLEEEIERLEKIISETD